MLQYDSASFPVVVSAFIGDALTGNFTVRTNGVHTQDGGIYRLGVNQGAADTDTEQCSIVFVLGTPQKATLSSDNNNVIGRKSELICNSLSTTYPSNHTLNFTYNWKINDVSSPANSRYYYSSSKKTLIIMNVSREDAGKRFKCSATESGDGVTGYTSDYSDEFIYTVIYGPDECKLSLSSPLTLEEGETSSTISCSSECYPPCSYRWRNVSAGIVIGADGKFQLEKATRYQTGNYECTCRNNATEYTKTHTSTLQIVVQHTSFFVEGNEGRNEITVDEYNEDVRFKCLITTQWESTVQIMFQGVILKEQFQTRSLSFSYNSITCLHAGIYTCGGNNEYGKVPSATIKVFVRCSPRPLRQTNQNFTGSLYESVTLNLSTLAYPEPGSTGFLWHKESGMRWISLRSNTDLLISSSGLHSSLTIMNVSQQDYGQYRVTVTNAIGSYEHYLFLVDRNEQKNESTTVNCTVETDKTGLIVGICFGILSAVLTVYSTFITIALKRKTSNTGTQSKEESTKQTTYINVAEGGTSRNDSGSSGNKNNSIELYTDLARSSVDDKTTYDVIQKI
ncbi:carcinoembryonic antigen-related cell adhesion molecule 5-like [Mercenaria mercenaria]|uniref:carcinoembryonic antigen-related cell adhesion molecule 5-like n=1 Tax=Mercenaria mercenaria TaxID=6596 RepID=UPI00234F44D9|nr:carcinoembryonic antigen-related cell adhesion molecule 5-like [Mercenaria mercenaria]